MSTVSPLAQRKCIPCTGNVPPLKGQALQNYARQLPGWRVVDEHHLLKHFPFGEFRDGVQFTMAVADLAEQQGHHPDILLTYSRVEISIYTHKADGLTESDFVLAAKIDQLVDEKFSDKVR